MKYLLGADIGTTSLKASVFDETGKLMKFAVRDYTLICSGDNVEFPAEGYWELFKSAYDEVTDGFEISALAVDTQCETLILTDENGVPVRNAIVWLDNRAALQSEKIKAKFGNKYVYEHTGQPEITATWPASKLLWLRENEPETIEKAKKIFLLEDFILYRLTGKFVTEKTLQASSLYLDIKKGEWWDEMLDFIGISKDMLPEICGSGEYVGEFCGAKVYTGAMDQVAGAIGAGVLGKGKISQMIGTTMALFAPVDEMPPYDPESVIPCHLNYDGGFCMLPWSSTAGIALKWFKNAFCESFDFKELDELAASVPPGSAGLTFLPYLCGSTIPKYDPTAKGAFIGFTMEHTRAHAVRSILESVACMLKSSLDYLKLPAEEIRSTGGGSKSPLWCAIQADMTGKNISVLENGETACLGSAILAGHGAGIIPDIAKFCDNAVRIKKVYTPSGTDYSECYRNYCVAEGKIL